MSNEVISRDANRATVGAGVSDDADTDIIMFRTDSSTKRLLIDISNVGSTSATGGSVASRDENHRPVCLAYDETNYVLQEVLTDENGYLLCDVVIE